MRQIKFRGKREDNGEWVYGDLIQSFCENKSYIDSNHCFDIKHILVNPPIEVDIETVGQFTGLYDGTKWEQLTIKEKDDFLLKGNKISDWKGKEIYEDDIIASDFSYNFVVFINEGHTKIKWFNNIEDLFQFYIKDEEVIIIGNIHDNPQLLKKNNAT